MAGAAASSSWIHRDDGVDLQPRPPVEQAESTIPSFLWSPKFELPRTMSSSAYTRTQVFFFRSCIRKPSFVRISMYVSVGTPAPPCPSVRVTPAGALRGPAFAFALASEIADGIYYWSI